MCVPPPIWRPIRYGHIQWERLVFRTFVRSAYFGGVYRYFILYHWILDTHIKYRTRRLLRKRH